MSNASTEPELKDIAAQQVICIEHKGAYAEIGAVYRKLAAWAAEKKVKVSGKGRTVFLDPPSEIIPESARYQVCLPVEGAVKGDSQVKVTRLPAQKAYCYVYQGPYDKIGAKYSELLAWMSVQQLTPAGAPFEVYVKAPKADGSVAAKDLVTEICVPVKE